MPADPPGVPAFVTLGRKPLTKGPGLEPQRVRHAALGLQWIVEDVLSSWKHPDPAAVHGRRVLAERFRVRAWGPLPGQPGERGYVVLEIRRYGAPRGWWVTPV
jgi:hypothetical protein